MSHQNKLFCIYLVIATIAIIFPQVAFGADDKAIEFKFNPPDGTKFTESYKSTEVITIDNQKVSTVVTEAKAQYIIRKKEGGFSVTVLPISFSVKEDGSKSTEIDPLEQTMRNSVIEYTLNCDGICTNVSGIEKMVQDIIAFAGENIKPEIAANLPELTAEFVQSEIDSWNDRFAALSGVKAKPGESWKTDIEYELPIGISIPISTTLKFTGMVKKNKRDYATIQRIYTVDSDAMEIATGEELRDMAKSTLPILNRFNISSMETFMKAEQVIDPATMLIQSETSKSTTKMSLSVTGEGKFPMIVDQYEQSTFEYSKSEPEDR